jgi:nicotinamidase-related amidase
MKALIVIDMQHDFIDGPLGTPEAVAIIPHVQKKIDEYNVNGCNIIFTRDTHFENYLSTQEGAKLPVKHCVLKTPGWCIHEAIQSQYGAAIVNKYTFGYDEWNAYCDILDIEHIEVVGVCTDICVISNVLALKACYPDAEITVDASCCAGTTPENHKAALQVMKSCQVNVINE